MLGPDEKSLLPFMMRQRMAPGQIPGPVAPQQLTPGFRAPAMGGAPGMAAPTAMPGMDPSAMAGLAALMGGMKAGPNEMIVNATNDKAGTSDPMAQGAAQVADASRGSFGSWLRGLF